MPALLNIILICLASVSIKRTHAWLAKFTSGSNTHVDFRIFHLLCMSQTAKPTELQAGLLLTGLKDATNSLYYAPEIDVDTVLTLVRDKSYIYTVALDCFDGDVIQAKNHLRYIANTSKNFLKSRKFWNRVEILDKLNEIVSDNGIFACLLGGKSTGKTFLLKQLKDNKDHRVIFVDLRENSDLFDALVTALELVDRPSLMILLQKHILSNIDITPQIKNVKVKASTLFESISPAVKTSYLLKLLTHVIDEFKGISMSIVIDEADVAFKIDQNTTAEEIKRSKEVLSLFVSLTRANYKVYCPFFTIFFFIS